MLAWLQSRLQLRRLARNLKSPYAEQRRGAFADLSRISTPGSTRLLVATLGLEFWEDTARWPRLSRISTEERTRFLVAALHLEFWEPTAGKALAALQLRGWSPTTVRERVLATIFANEKNLPAIHERLSALGTEAVPVLIELLVKLGPWWWWREWELLLALSKIGDWRAFETFAAKLGATEGKLKSAQAAARALGQLGDRRAIPLLLHHLQLPYPPSGNWYREQMGFRAAAARALGSLGDRSAIPVLVGALQNVHSDDVRAAAAEALGSLGDPSAIPALVRTLQDASSREWGARAAAANALGAIGEPVIPVLVHALQDKMSNVRDAAAQALERLLENNPGRIAAENLHCLASLELVRRVEHGRYLADEGLEGTWYDTTTVHGVDTARVRQLAGLELRRRESRVNLGQVDSRK